MMLVVDILDIVLHSIVSIVQRHCSSVYKLELAVPVKLYQQERDRFVSKVESGKMNNTRKLERRDSSMIAYHRYSITRRMPPTPPLSWKCGLRCFKALQRLIINHKPQTFIKSNASVGFSSGYRSVLKGGCR